MSGPAVADLLVALARDRFELFHDANDDAWAWDGTDAHRIGSDAFEQRLSRDFYGATGKVPSKNQLSQAVTGLRGMAMWDGPEHPVGLRVAAHAEAVVVDLADEGRRVVVVGPEGWTVTSESPVRFHRPQGMRSLPVPLTGGTLDGLAQLWRLNPHDLALVLGWLLGFFTPTGSKPLLDLSGTQGSGKSMLARMLVSLLDPNAPQLLTMPPDPRTLAIIAKHRGVLAFDNVSSIPGELSDALCRMADGAGFQTRKLYTDDDLATFTGSRPVLLTGIPEVAREADLVDRTISVVVPEIGPGDRLTETAILSEFERLRPGIFGLLLDGVSSALSNVSTTVLREEPRMLDVATWVEAAAPAVGLDPEAFLDAYVANRRDASSGVVEGSFIGQFVPALADEGFTGTATDCLQSLVSIAGPDGARHRAWPGSPKGLAGILRRLAPAFAEQGVVVEFVGATGHDRHRIIRIHRDAQGAGPPAPVVPFTVRHAKPDPAVRRVVEALREAGIGPGSPVTKAAAVAMEKAGGNASLAVRALNETRVPAPGGGTWTADAIRGVV